ncbi:histidinol dehydrogenase [soil metagenome]
MQIIINPVKESLDAILKRPAFDATQLSEKVQAILDDVKSNGDRAVKKYTIEFDKIMLNDFAVNEEEIAASETLLSTELKQAIQQAAANIKTFHAKQLSAPEIIETMPGIACWRKNVAIEKVGLYIPGGTAPLFSTVLMLAIPANLAGCNEIILCSPPDVNGKLHAAVLYAAGITGITKIYKVGGVQAIAAMAFGTETMSKVYKIFGPGNQYVTCAKQLIQQQGIAIDMPAGPSEVCVLADETANASFIAADLLSQAEHGADSQVLLVCNSTEIADNVITAIELQIKNLPRQLTAIKALEKSKVVVLDNIDDAVTLINEYAPEHLIISCKNEDAVAEKIINAGSVFIGNYSPESVGDYASGTNHTLPTNGFAKVYSGVSIDSFVKKITFQKLTQQGLHNIADTVIQMAEAEGLQAHANAVKVRMKTPQAPTAE